MITEIYRFKIVAEIGNITKAAEQLFITQPALTQSIHRLERELNTKVFHNSGKTLALTNNGKTLYLLACKILILWEKAKTSLPITQIISIGLFDNAALLFFNLIQNELKEQKVDLTIDRSKSLLTNLNLGILDICICVQPENEKDFPNIIRLAHYKEILVPVAGKLFKGEANTLPFIGYTKNSLTGKYIISEFLNNNIQPKIIVESVNALFIKDLAQKNLGIGILPYNIVSEEIKHKKLFIQKLPFKFTRTCAIYKNIDAQSPLLDKILTKFINNIKLNPENVKEFL